MIESLHIQNIALIEDLTLNLEKGLNILSGETGAGKSIIIDSLNFVLGERADKNSYTKRRRKGGSVRCVFRRCRKTSKSPLKTLGLRQTTC
ncbi:MAG: AAA family ATPase [Clostridiales bacterium]|nr:MAG: AAA family ATPase [Clostridiales bacterium]